MDLKQTIDNWFSTLYQKVYMISNPGFHFDAVYQHCLLETADVLMPFGDIPRKISLQVKKSFLASKVLQDALTVGSRVVDELLNMRSNVKCAQAFMKMTQCPMCSGIAEKVKPCYNYCMNVMKGCTAYPAVVGPAWNAYVTALHKLAIKADGPFSMEAIIDPLGVKISEGIMFFQFNRQNITTHVSFLSVRSLYQLFVSFCRSNPIYLGSSVKVNDKNLFKVLQMRDLGCSDNTNRLLENSKLFLPFLTTVCKAN